MFDIAHTPHVYIIDEFNDLQRLELDQIKGNFTFNYHGLTYKSTDENIDSCNYMLNSKILAFHTFEKVVIYMIHKLQRNIEIIENIIEKDND